MSEESEKYFAERPYLSEWMNSAAVASTAENAETLDRNGAISYLKSDLFKNVGFEGTELISFIVDSIPENYRDTKAKLDQLDLRPFIDIAVTAKVAELQKNPVTYNAMAFQALSTGQQSMREALDSRYRAGFEEFVVALNPAGISDAKLKAEVDRLMNNTRGYSPKAIANSRVNEIKLPTSTEVSPQDVATDQAAQDAQQAGTAGDGFDVTGGGADGGYDFTQDYQTQLRLNPDMDITDLVSGGSVFEGDSSEVFNASGLVQQITGMVASEDNKMWDLNEAITFIYSYQDDPKKVKRLQRLLTDSGYFQTLNALPEAGQIDDVTRQAWNLFLTDALRFGRTPLDQAKNAQKAFQSRLAGDTGYMAIDSATISSTARQLGEAIIGRPLSAKETYDLVNKAKDWQREAFVRGQTDPEQMQTDIQAQIEQHLRKTYNNDIVLDSISASRQAMESVFGGAS